MKEILQKLEREESGRKSKQTALLTLQLKRVQSFSTTTPETVLPGQPAAKQHLSTASGAEISKFGFQDCCG